MQPPLAADSAAGKAKVERQCAQCHRPSDFNGETTVALESLIKDLNSGKLPHAKKAIQLSSEDIADIAAYWTLPQKKR